MKDWKSKFKKRQDNGPNNGGGVLLPKPQKTRIVEVRNPNSPFALDYYDEPIYDSENTNLEQTNYISGESEKKISGFFSKRRLSYVWGWVAFCCIYAILLSAVPYLNEQDNIRRESAPRYEFDFTNLTEILTKKETPKRFNPYIILVVVSTLFFISSLVAWLSVQKKDVKAILQKKNCEIYFIAKGSLFSVGYSKVLKMQVHQLLCRTKYSIFHFLILELNTESGVYTLGQSVAESKNYGLEMKKGGFYGIQLLSVESDTVFNMAKFLGLI